MLAGYKEHDSNCIRLSGDERIMGRLSELLERAAERAEVTVTGPIMQAERVYNAAFEAKQYSAAMTVQKEIGILRPSASNVVKLDFLASSLAEIDNMNLMNFGSSFSGR